jgi:DNA-binding winged helix-turn-helix (wHTH) protein
MLYHFGPFTLDPTAFRLTRNGEAIRLSPQSIEVLTCLVERPDRLVTKSELFAAVWRNVVVTDNALTQAVSDIRQVLADDVKRPTYVQTVARRGYRFIAPVSSAQSTPIDSVRSYRPKDTASLDALRLVQEGRIHLESLDTDAVPTAVACFERAVAVDPGYASAYIGLANAKFWQYQQGRYRTDVQADLLSEAIAHARVALRLEPLFAEVHATLSHLLVAADQTVEAREAALRAVALEPGYWAHYFRLANATWGDERLHALQRCQDLYGAFSFAYFQQAMVLVARHQFDLAERVLQQGTAVRDGQVAHRLRFPANGLQWLLGAIRLRQGDAAAALRAFEQERESGRTHLYATEFAVGARTASGFARLRLRDPDGAIEAFRGSLMEYSVQPRAHLGLVVAFGVKGLHVQSQHASQQAADDIAVLERAGRVPDAEILQAGLHVVHGRPDRALESLRTWLTAALPGSAGWLIPIEPLFERLHRLPGYADVHDLLVSRAR